jgi:hypothetical protein
MELLLRILMGWLLVVGAARLMYELITPITPVFILVLASLLAVRLLIARRRI